MSDMRVAVQLGMEGDKQVQQGLQSVEGSLGAVGTSGGKAAVGLKAVADAGDRISSGLGAVGGGLASTSDGLDKVGMSAKQTAAALRGIPMQMTDVVTSLASGQPPLQVLMQQGGQLKDMFGGIGPAAKAVGGYVAGLVNPFSLAAAAAAGLTYAYYEGSKETDTLRNALILTGNAAGATVGELQGYAREISGIVGTQGKATEALAAFAQTGKIGGDSLKEFSQAAIEFERATGTAVEKTAKQFADLAGEPLKATIKLNEGMNYLTEGTYRQIKALQDQGRTDDAAALAQKTYSDALAARAGEIQKNLGSIERSWLTVKDGAKSAWDAMLNVGRASSMGDQLAEVNKKIAEAEKKLGNPGFGENGGGERFGRVSAGRNAAIQAELDLLKSKKLGIEELIDSEKKSAQQQAENTQRTQASIEFDKMATGVLDKKAKMNQELAKAQELGAAAGRSQVEIEKTLAGIREKYAEKKSGGLDTGASELATLKSKLKAEQDYARQLDQSGLGAKKATEAELTYARYADLATKAKDGKTAATYRDMAATAQQWAEQQKANQVTEKSLKSEAEHQVEIAKSIDEIYKKADSLNQEAAAQEAANTIFGKGKTAIEEMRLAKDQERLATLTNLGLTGDTTKALEAEIAARQRVVQSLKDNDLKVTGARTDELMRAAKEQASLYEDELKLAGLTTLERAKIVAQRQVEIKYAKELADIERQINDEKDPERRALLEEQRIQRLQAKQIESSAAVNKVVQEDWAKTSDQINQSLTDALMRGFESGKGFLRNLGDTAVNLFKTMVLRPTITAAFTPVAAGINSAFGINGGPPSGGAMGTIQTASNINTLWGTASQALYGGSAGASLASLGYANAAGMVGGDALGALIAANGSWAGVATGASAAAEAAVAANLALEAGTAVALEAGTLATASAATTASAASTFTAAMQAIPGWGWALAGAALLATSMDNSGTPHSGGVASYSAGSGIKVGTDGGAFGTAFGAVDTGQVGMDLAKSTAVGLAGLLDDMAKAFGRKAGYEVITAFADDSSSDGAWGALKINLGGQSVLNWDDSKTSRWAPKEFADGQAGIEEYKKAIAADVKTYLVSQAPEWAKGIFEGLGDAPTLEKLGSAAQSVANLHKLLGALGENVLPSLATATDGSIAAMVKAAGGADALTAALASYYDATATDLDRQQFAFTSLSKALEPLGLTLPSASAGLQDWYDGLVQTASAQDLSVQANAEHLTSLLALSPAITAMSGVWDSTRESLFGADALGVMANAALRGDAVATSIVNAAGGLEQYGQKVASYHQHFSTSAEKTAAATAQVTAELAKVGLTMPKTRSEFKSMMDAALAMGDAGKGTVSVLLDVGEAIAGLVPESKDFLKEFLDEVPNTLSGVLTGLVTGREGAQEEGAKLAKSVSDGIYEAIAQGQTAQIAQQFMANIVNPIVANVAASRSMLDGVDLAGGVATAKTQIQALRDTLADPQIAGAIREITGAVNGLVGAAGGAVAAVSSGPFAIGGTATNTGIYASLQDQTLDLAGVVKDITDTNSKTAQTLAGLGQSAISSFREIDDTAQGMFASLGGDRLQGTINGFEAAKAAAATMQGKFDAVLAAYQALPASLTIGNGYVDQAVTAVAEQLHALGLGITNSVADTAAYLAGNMPAVVSDALEIDPVTGSKFAIGGSAVVDPVAPTANPIAAMQSALSRWMGSFAPGVGDSMNATAATAEIGRLQETIRQWTLAQKRLVAAEDLVALGQEAQAALDRTAELQLTGGLSDPITQFKESYAQKLYDMDNGIVKALNEEISKTADPAKVKTLEAEIEKYRNGLKVWSEAQSKLLSTEMLVDVNGQIKDLQTQDQGPLTAIKAAIDKYVADLKALGQYTAAAQASVDQLSGLQLGKARDELYAQLVPQEEQNAKALAGLKADFAALGQVMPETAAALRVMIDAASGDTKDKLLELVPAFVALQPAAEGAAASAETVAQAYARLRTVTRTAEQVAQERIDLEERLFAATASQAEIANLARLRIDEYNRSLYDQVIAAEAAKQAVADTRTTTDQALSEVKRLIGAEITRLQGSFKATDTAYSAVERAVAAQKSTLTEQLNAAKQAESAISGIFGALRDQLRELRGETVATAAMQAAQGRELIQGALATGVLPQQEQLQQAIHAARAGLDATQFASATDRDRAYIALQNELEALQGIAQPQLSAAEQSVALAEEQIDKLDLQLKSAKALVDQVRGVDTRVLGVQDAIGALESAVATEAAARDQIAVLNGQLENAQAQYEALRGIKTGVEAIGPALQALADAIAGEQSAGAKAAALAAAAAAQRQAITQAAGGQFGASLEYVRDFGAGSAMADTSYASQREADIASLYQNVLGRAADSGGLAWYTGTAMSIAEIAASLEASREDDIRDAYGGAAQQAFNDQVNSALGLTSDIRIPGFAVGATEIPQDMLAVVHKGEQIIPAAWNPATSGWADSVRGSDPRVADLIARLIDHIVQLERALGAKLDEGNRNTDGTRTILRRVTGDSDKVRMVPA